MLPQQIEFVKSKNMHKLTHKNYKLGYILHKNSKNKEFLCKTLAFL